MVPDLSVLWTACLVERDFTRRYEMTARKAEGRAREVFEMLAQRERSHEALFKQMHDRAFEEYARMP